MPHCFHVPAAPTNRHPMIASPTSSQSVSAFKSINGELDRVGLILDARWRNGKQG
jgi:hypothetical protein